MRALKFMFISLFVFNPLIFSSSIFAEVEEYTITIKDHRFTPEELMIPANQKVKLIIQNDDPTAEEFESDDLHREKIVTGNRKITIVIGPLKPGQYKYSGEFHKDTAQGVIIVQ